MTNHSIWTTASYFAALAEALNFLEEGERNEIIAELRSHVEDKLSRFPERSEADILRNLGTPDEIADRYRSECSQGSESTKQRGSRREHSFDWGRELGAQINRFVHQIVRASEEMARVSSHFGSSFAAATTVFHVSAKEVCALEIELGSGDIEIVGSNIAELEIRLDIDSDITISMESIGLAPSDGVLRISEAELRRRLGVKAHSLNGVSIMVPFGLKASARTLSGDISLSDLSGTVVAHATSGDISAIRIAGNLTAHSESGDMSGEDLGGSVAIDTSSGDIEIELGEIKQDVSLKSKSGDVSLTTQAALQGEFTLTSASGDIHVETSEWSSVVEGGQIQRTFGTTEPRISLVSKSGDIYLGR
jgi:DUF4097 and DUF4098 domain-containing protein YvlB